MNKILLYFAIVAFGVFGVLVLSNQNKPTPSANIPLFITPSPAQSTTAQTTQPPAIITPMPTNPPTGGPTPVKNASKAFILTTKGEIDIDLYTQDAPKTVANFINKVSSGFYDNLTFHRVEDWVIQGGDPKGNGTGGGNMPTELNNLPFVTGAVGVARGQDINISNDAQFFIVKKTSSFLDKQYTNFGIVTKGLDVVNKIQVGDKILGISLE